MLVFPALLQNNRQTRCCPAAYGPFYNVTFDPRASKRVFRALKNVYVLSLFLFPDPSLTPKNLSTVLDIMSDRLWRRFGAFINIPGSELDRIERQCTSHRECKQALIHTFLSSHPAPSWTLVAWALYMTEWNVEDSSCLRALDHLQELFPTGIYNSVNSCSITLLLSLHFTPMQEDSAPNRSTSRR